MSDPVEFVRGDARAHGVADFDMRMRSMVSVSLTSDPVKRSGAVRPTYSGRGMFDGTVRIGVGRPGVNGSEVRRADMREV